VQSQYFSHSRRVVIGAAALALGWGLTTTASAQSVESALAPPKGAFEAAPLAPPPSSIVPDIPHDSEQRTEVKSRWFTLKSGFVAIADYSAFSQDEESLWQVGEQENQWDARAARLMFHGTVGGGYRASYLVAAEYKGFDSDPETTWSVTDVSMTFPLGSPAVKLTIGKTKENFAYEMVGDAANLPQMERVLSPFFVSRNVGAKVVAVLGRDHRMTLAGGVFNNWFVEDVSLKDSGTDATGRATGLLWDRRGGASFLHVGVAGRYAGGDNDILRYKGRPESNVADNFVDTGNLASDHAWHVGLEALWNEGPYSLLAEYNRASVASAAAGHPDFSGYYLTGSWVLTGETRPYDRTVGYARRIIPKGRWGAPELVARYSHIDLDDGAVQGGSFNKTHVGLNWWATRRWKFGVGWGRTWLRRFGTTGRTDSLLTRLQWVF
jgi:phosphate-selective porin OprO/OprP